MGILLSPARTNTLSLSWTMERILTSLVEVISGQRESIASGFVKPSAEFQLGLIPTAGMVKGKVFPHFLLMWAPKWSLLCKTQK